MLITISNDLTAVRSRFVAPTLGGVKGGVRPQAAFDATSMGPQSWSPPIT
jgi:hypothetical protein